VITTDGIEITSNRTFTKSKWEEFLAESVPVGSPNKRSLHEDF
jgi:hypothetical protein